MKNINFNFKNSYEKLPEIFFSKIEPTVRENPRTLIINDDLAEELKLDGENLWKNGEILSGSKFPENYSGISQAYMGHQFGFFTMLGDGRALLLGEHLVDDKRYDIQLKGSGRTPYSRGGDGNATLGPMLREYIISEGLYHLGVPTSRSLAVTLTGEKVYRNGHEDGAVLTRVAKSHIRVGTFQFAIYHGEKEDLKILADYSIKRHYPEIEDSENKYLEFFKKVMENQIKLIALWQSIGFIHGVMNTDNMSISDEGFDYGPCAFMDKYDLKTVFSSIDSMGRYAYGNQPKIGAWNLARFAETLIPLVDEDKDKSIELLENELQKYSELFEIEYKKLISKKLGFREYEETDDDLIMEFLDLLGKYNPDYTNIFLDLSYRNFKDKIYEKEDFKTWIEKWENRLLKEGNDEENKEFMLSVNPQIIPRNYWVQKAIEEGEKGNPELMAHLLQELQNPFTESKEKEKYKIVPDIEFVSYCGT